MQRGTSSYRIFYIDDITTLVPLSDAIMPEHRPTAREDKAKKGPATEVFCL